MIEIEQLIGKPYEPGAQGPDSYDCWGLAKKVQKTLFNREMPSIKDPPTNLKTLIRFVKNHEARGQWIKSDGPKHGQLVELAHGKNPFHIGVYLDIDGGGLIHSVNPLGVCFDRLATLEAAGWRRFVYHDWNS